MRRAGLVLGVLALVACSRQAAQPPSDLPPPAETALAAEPPVAAIPTPPAPEPTATIGGDGSEIVLNPVTAADLQGVTLEGELACSFTIGGSGPLIIARGDASSSNPAFGVIKVGDYVERIAAPGGYDGMLKGATFNGQGKTVTIAVADPAQGGGESPPGPATLTYHRADGARRVYPGAWTCGP